MKNLIYCLLPGLLITISSTSCEKALPDPCIYQSTFSRDDFQGYDDSPVLVSYAVRDSGNVNNIYYVNCYERQCISNDYIATIYSKVLTPVSVDGNTVLYADSSIVSNPGLYTCLLAVHKTCDNAIEILDEYPFTIWYPQLFHPCE